MMKKAIPTYVPKDWDINERPEWVDIALTSEERNSPSIQKLLRMFTYMRPAWSSTEERFIEEFIDPVEGVFKDTFGNRICFVDYEDGTPSKVLWSSHTDTVHSKEGKQRIRFTNDIIRLKDKTKASCLGADDTAGVWLMLEMIEHGIPGTYIFHRAEEIGGLGSNYIAKNYSSILSNLDYAIAFDRRGYTSIISRQSGKECCSQAFVDSLGDLLALPLKDDKTGSFTDTASYTHIIPECTNVATGYHKAHSSAEVQDVRFLMYLKEAILLNWDETKLVAERDPSKPAYSNSFYRKPVVANNNKQSNVVPYKGSSFASLVKNNPEVAVKMLEECGITKEDFEDTVFINTGFMPHGWFDA